MNDICSLLYIKSKMFIKQFDTMLRPLGLTYTQFLVLEIIFENKKINATNIGNRLELDSGTMTPLLKKLCDKNYVIRDTDKNDARNLIYSLSKQGREIYKKAVRIRTNILCKVSLKENETASLIDLLSHLTF